MLWMNRTSTLPSGKVVLDAKGVAEKIEELTLYVIELQKQVEELKKINNK